MQVKTGCSLCQAWHHLARGKQHTEVSHCLLGVCVSLRDFRKIHSTSQGRSLCGKAVGGNSLGLELTRWEQLMAPASASLPRQSELPCPSSPCSAACQFSSSLCPWCFSHWSPGCVRWWVSKSMCRPLKRIAWDSSSQPEAMGTPLPGGVWDLPVPCLHPSPYQSSCGFFISLVIGLVFS